MERRAVQRNNRVVVQVLIKWKQKPVSEATWEDYCALIRRFPAFDSVEQALV